MTGIAFVSYPGFVADIKKTYSKDYLKAQHALGVTVREYKQWDKTDLLKLYDSYFGKLVFNHLVGLALQARREERIMKANPGRKISSFAQNDLAAIAPTGMGWREYADVIAEAVSEIRTLSFKITHDLKTLFERDAAESMAGILPEAPTRASMKPYIVTASYSGADRRRVARAA